MAGVGTALTAGKWGLGLSMLAAMTGQARGDNAGAVDGFAGGLLNTDTLKWVLSFFIPEEDLDNNPILKALDGNEAPLSLGLASLLLAPSGYKKFGVIAAVAWAAQKIFAPNLFNGISGATTSKPEQKPILAEISDAQIAQAQVLTKDLTAATATATPAPTTASAIIADARAEATRVDAAAARGTKAVLAKATEAIAGLETGKYLVQIDGQNIDLTNGTSVVMDLDEGSEVEADAPTLDEV